MEITSPAGAGRDATRPQQLSPALFASRKNPLFDTGFFILAYLFWLVALTNILFVFDITISQYHCLAAAPLAWATLWVMLGRHPGYSLVITLAGIAVIAASAYAMTLINDVGWDSNYYHKADVGFLAQGWNPLRQSMGEFTAETALITDKSDWLPWYDPYPKATYTIGACFYVLFGTIEAGKCYNILAMISLICIGTELLRKTAKLKGYQAFMVAFLIAVNPVTLAQMLSYHNDGFLASMLGICAITLAYFLFTEQHALYRRSWAALLFALSLGLNSKFSAVVHFGLLCALFYLCLILTRYERYSLRRARRYLLRVTVFFTAAVLCAFLLLGATSYVVNTFRYHNPFYTIIGEDATSLVDHEAPAFISDMSKAGKFFAALFSHADNRISEATDNGLKIPFTFTADEWDQSAAPDVRISGWGLLFGGILILSLIVLLSMLIYRRYTNKKPMRCRCALLLLAYLLVPPVLITGLWWAKYNVQMFWIPAMAMVLLFQISNQSKQRQRWQRCAAACLAAIICAMLLFDLAPAVRYLHSSTVISAQVDALLDSLAEDGEDTQYYVTICDDLFYGAAFNLYDLGISFTIVTEEELPQGVEYRGTYHVYLAVYSLSEIPDSAAE